MCEAIKMILNEEYFFNEHLIWLTGNILNQINGNSKELSDVNFVCKDGRVEFNKVVLSMLTSTEMSLLLSSSQLQDDAPLLILMPDFGVETIQGFKDLVCQGWTTFSSDGEAENIENFCRFFSLELSLNLEKQSKTKAGNATCDNDAPTADLEPTKHDNHAILALSDLLSNREAGCSDTCNNDTSLAWANNFSPGESVYKVCYVCNKTMLGLHLLLKHLRSHDPDEGPFQCCVCPSNFPCATMLHEHLRDHFKGHIGDDGKGRRCGQCKKRFKSKSAHLKHQSTHKKMKYRCIETTCSFASFNAKLFTRHVVDQHQRKPFECPLCGSGYLHKSNYDDHMASNHGNSDRTFACDFCSKTFKSRPNLLVHRREQHELGDSRLVECKICGFKSKGLRNLRKHSQIHNEEASKKFQCSHCSRMFRSKNSLVVHERVHTGETPYTCQICQVSFKRRHHLSCHLKTAGHTTRLKQL